MLNTALLLLQPVELNGDEERKLAIRRRMAPTIDGVNHMNPVLSIGTKVIERLLPFLGRIAKESPSHWAKLVAELKAKSGVAVATANDVVAYARQNPVNAALVFTTIASMGISVADLFSSADKSDTEVRKTAITLDQITVGANERSQLLISNVAAASETLKLGAADREVELRTLADICTFAKGHFGSARAALEGHQKLQAFFEIPYADLETGFNILKS